MGKIQQEGKDLSNSTLQHIFNSLTALEIG